MNRLRQGIIMKNILVVDDTIVNLKMAEMVLKETYKPYLVPSGEMAIRFLKKKIPDLILLDVLMPDMDGFETLQAIRNETEAAAVPVVFLTADTDEETRKKAQEFLVSDFVLKPFQKETLLNSVKKIIGQ